MSKALASGESSVTFRVKVRTAFGEEVYVCGSDDILGNWDIAKAVALRTDADTFPTWEVAVVVPSDSQLEFKFIIKRGDELVCWESTQQNRSLKVEDDYVTLEADYDVDGMSVKTDNGFKPSFEATGMTATTVASDRAEEQLRSESRGSIEFDPPLGESRKLRPEDVFTHPAQHGDHMAALSELDENTPTEPPASAFHSITPAHQSPETTTAEEAFVRGANAPRSQSPELDRERSVDSANAESERVGLGVSPEMAAAGEEEPVKVVRPTPQRAEASQESTAEDTENASSGRGQKASPVKDAASASAKGSPVRKAPEEAPSPSSKEKEKRSPSGRTAVPGVPASSGAPPPAKATAGGTSTESTEDDSDPPASTKAAPAPSPAAAKKPAAKASASRAVPLAGGPGAAAAVPVDPPKPASEPANVPDTHPDAPLKGAEPLGRMPRPVDPPKAKAPAAEAPKPAADAAPKANGQNKKNKRKGRGR